MWTHRLILESYQHEENAFVTLTYSDEYLPSGGTLVPKDLQDWLKRFRKEVYPAKVRYYGVGEYGDQSERPHYHLAIFGFPGCLQGRSIYNRHGYSCCEPCRIVARTWARGIIVSDQLNEKSAQYIAGYVTKKLTSKDDPRLKGRHPEFARMSLRPAIGLSALHEVAAELLRYNLVESQGDVPSALRHGKRLLPLGRYMKRKLRLMVGESENAPQEVVDEAAADLQAMLDVALDNPEKYGSFRETFRQEVANAADVKVKQMEGRSKIRRVRTL